MPRFEVVSPYQPTGDQPEAVEKLAQGFIDGKKFQTLLGVTGSGKTFTMANIIEKIQKPTLVIAHNKTLAASVSILPSTFAWKPCAPSAPPAAAMTAPPWCR